jgi:hypothetical protein
MPGPKGGSFSFRVSDDAGTPLGMPGPRGGRAAFPILFLLSWVLDASSSEPGTLLDNLDFPRVALGNTKFVCLAVRV